MKLFKLLAIDFVAVFFALGMTYSSPRPTVVFWGDSITNHWDTSSDFPQYNAINAGIGGQTSAEIAGRFLHDVEPYKPKIVVIEAGTNDMYDSNTSMIDTLINIQSMIVEVQSIGAKPILCSLVPIDAAGWSAHFSQSTIHDLNGALRQLASQDGIEFVDYYDALQGKSGVTVDGLHPNLVGYALMKPLLDFTS